MTPITRASAPDQRIEPGLTDARMTVRAQTPNRASNATMGAARWAAPRRPRPPPWRPPASPTPSVSDHGLRNLRPPRLDDRALEPRMNTNRHEQGRLGEPRVRYGVRW